MVIQPCCAFQIMTGSRSIALRTNARYGPGRRKCLRAGGQRTKNSIQQTHWNRLVYLLNDPNPIQRPTQSHGVQPGGCSPAVGGTSAVPCTARQPTIMAAIQN